MSFHNLFRSDVFSCKMPVEKDVRICLISLPIKVGLFLLCLNAIGSKEKFPCLKLWRSVPLHMWWNKLSGNVIILSRNVHFMQMATFNISNVIGVDPKPFDPSTYVEENYYVTDISGSKRHLPSANIIRWRQVSGPGGKISVSYHAVSCHKM